MPSWMRATTATLLAGLALAAPLAHGDAAAPLPLALRGVHPDKLSSGLFAALDADGAFGARPPPARLRAGTPGDLAKGVPPVTLDARVGANLSVGGDPPALPASQRNQAEPHLVRSAANPDVLLATFQDGRFSADGGALDLGYALSRDGGLTWTRALTPQLTVASGGSYQRATDPVAAIGPLGELYLNGLASLNGGTFSTVVVSRSLDQGLTWSAPLVVYQSSSATTLPDKNWLVANDFPAAPNLGRLVATWTNFTSTPTGVATGNHLVAAVSDDRGATWSAPVNITPVGSNHQGTQPLFLPDGTLVVVYAAFVNPDPPGPFILQCKRSLDGGRTFPAAATTIVPSIEIWNDPQLRHGAFLPSATVARNTGELFVTYVGLVGATPRVFVVKSGDSGASWSAPVAVSDQPAGISVVNPAIAASPDGRIVSVVFLDKRNAPGGVDFVDHYAAVSLDGGASWRPNLRLSELSSDIRYATPTSRGYMLGDYLAVAPPLAANQPCIAIWCDTRTGESNPMTVRFTPADTPTFDAWRSARHSPAELADTTRTGPTADFDGDGRPNFAEYLHQTDPRVAESGSLFAVDVVPAGAPFSPATSVGIGYRYRLAFGSGANLRWEQSADGATWRAAPQTTIPNDFPQPNDHAGRTLIPLAGGPYFREVVATRADFADAVPVETFAVNTDARLSNLSTRGRLLDGASQLIGGLVTRGAARTLLVRGVGPTLGQLAPSLSVAENPLLRFVDPATGAEVSNDDIGGYGASMQAMLRDLATSAGAFPLGSDKESVLVVTRPAGAYTPLVTNLATTGGRTGLVEIYDVSADRNGELVNLSSRGEVGGGDDALIAGVFIRGTQPRRLLFRAVGPSLSRFNIPGALLADPVLTIYRDNTVVARNDDWQLGPNAAAVAATASRVGAFALDASSLDSALLLPLAPGAYTAVVTSADGGTGIALVEIYDAN